MDAITDTERRTAEKFERQESAKRSFSSTAECVALCEELAPRLAEVLADKLNERTPLMLELRPLGPHALAIAGLTMALESIVIERGEPEATIALGRAVQGELWARKQPRKTRTKMIKSVDPQQSSREAGYNVRDWPRSHAAQVGNFLKGALDARDIPRMMTVTDKWSEDARALVPIPAIPPSGPWLRRFGAGDESGVHPSQPCAQLHGAGLAAGGDAQFMRNAKLPSLELLPGPRGVIASLHHGLGRITQCEDFR